MLQFESIENFSFLSILHQFKEKKDFAVVLLNIGWNESWIQQQ